MSIIEEFNRALELVERFETYKLIRAWGLILIITGIARFLFGFIIWNLFSLIYDSLNIDTNNVSLLIAVFNSILRAVLIFSLAVIMFYTFVSIRKTSIIGGKIISSRVLFSGFTLAILYFLTFVIEIPGSVYWEEVAGVFLTYFALKNITKSDFKELLYLGITLFVISVIEFIGRLFLILYFYNKPAFIPLWITFYLTIGIAFMIPYIISGIRIFKKASFTLEER